MDSCASDSHAAVSFQQIIPVYMYTTSAGSRRQAVSDL